jgi:hypothetical protein
MTRKITVAFDLAALLGLAACGVTGALGGVLTSP